VRVLVKINLFVKANKQLEKYRFLIYPATVTRINISNKFMMRMSKHNNITWSQFNRLKVQWWYLNF